MNGAVTLLPSMLYQLYLKQKRENVSTMKAEIIGIYCEIHIRNGNIKCGIS
jgi:hypothetical protein